MTIRVYKLCTGEEIIGTVVEPGSDTSGSGRTKARMANPNATHDRDVVVLEKVRVIQVMQTGPGQIGVGMVPYSAACVDGEIAFSRSSVIAGVNHGQEIEDGYLQQTSGIALPTAGGIATP